MLKTKEKGEPFVCVFYYELTITNTKLASSVNI